MGPPQQLFKIVDNLTGKITGAESIDSVMGSLACSRSRPHLSHQTGFQYSPNAATKSSYLFLSREYSKQFSSRQAALNGSGSNLIVASAFGEIHPELIWIIRGIRKEEPLAGYEILEVIFFF
jgi:hypothetical protein